MPRAALVVLNYEGRALLDVVLPSALAQDHPDFEVVVVDDASRDGSAAYVAERWPQVRVLALARNGGVTAAMNRGVEATDAAVVALLNNDLELDEGWLSAAEAELLAHPECAAATGKMLRYRDRATIDAAGDAYFASGVAINRGAGELDHGQFDEREEVFSGCGGATLYRRAAFEDVGGFDEDLVAYLEDVEWGLRARLRGWSARYTPAARCFHMGGATTGRHPGRFAVLQRRNHLVLAVQDWPAGRLARSLPLLLAHQVLWFARSVADGVGPDHVRAWAGFARLLPRLLVKRRHVQASRRVPAAELDRAMRLGLPRTRLRALAVQLAPELVRRRGLA